MGSLPRSCLRAGRSNTQAKPLRPVESRGSEEEVLLTEAICEVSTASWDMDSILWKRWLVTFTVTGMRQGGLQVACSEG